jgi:predicted amidohydrolase
MKIALAQVDVAFGDVERNLATLRERAREAAQRGAQLLVFPECGLTGYAFATPEDVRRAALAAPGRRSSRASRARRRCSWSSD